MLAAICFFADSAPSTAAWPAAVPAAVLAAVFTLSATDVPTESFACAATPLTVD